MSAFASELARSEVTVPLSSFIRPHHAHYFSGRRDRPHYRHRQYSFPGIPTLFPLVRAFLDTCAVTYSRDYRYLFTLLGSELATNAIQHSRSSNPGGSFTLQVRRTASGLHLTCADRGSLTPWKRGRLEPEPGGTRAGCESGRGLVLIDTLATSWGDNAHPELRKVWFFLDHDLETNPWSQV